MLQQTLILIKPDGVKRKLVSEVLGRFEKRGFSFLALKQLVIDSSLSDQHYQEHVEKDFYPKLKIFINTSSYSQINSKGIFKPFNFYSASKEAFTKISAVPAKFREEIEQVEVAKASTEWVTDLGKKGIPASPALLAGAKTNGVKYSL